MTWADCDDNDSSSGSSANDQDCDGIEDLQDCDDNDDNIGDAIGSESACAAQSCSAIIESNPSATDGVYWVLAGENATQVFCDMSTDSGGWTVLQHDASANIMTAGYGIPSSASGWSLEYMDSNAFWNTLEIEDFYIEIDGVLQGIIKDVTLFGESTRPTTQYIFDGNCSNGSCPWSCDSDNPTNGSCNITDGDGRHWGRWVDNSAGCCLGNKGWWYYSHNDTTTYNYGICQTGYPNGTLASGSSSPTGCDQGYYTTFSEGVQVVKIAIRY